MQVGNCEEVPDKPLTGGMALCATGPAIKDQLFLIRVLIEELPELLYYFRDGVTFGQGDPLLSRAGIRGQWVCHPCR